MAPDPSTHSRGAEAPLGPTRRPVGRASARTVRPVPAEPEPERPSAGPRAWIPGPPLSGFVEKLWAYDSYGGGHPRERVLPTGTMEIVINARDDSWAPILCGAHSQSFVIETAASSSLLGVHFKPGGAFPFLGVPADEVQNIRMPLDRLWGRRAEELHQQILEARAPGVRFRILEHALIERASRPLARHRAVGFALDALGRDPGAGTIAELTRSIGLSARRFIEVFADEVGLTPKLYGRVKRFQAVLGLVHRQRTVDWADVAVGCGYYDQAHFIHDFRAFSGFSPSAYFRARGAHANHVPLDI